MKKTLIALMLTAALTSPAAAQKYNLTVAGYSPGGLVSTIGVGMDKALAKQYPGSTITYQTSSGGLANAMLIATGKVPIGLIGDHEFPIPFEGRPPFKKPIKNLRLLFKPYVASSRFQVTHVLVNKAFAEKHGLKTFADLKDKKVPMRIAINRPGNADGDVSLAFLSAVGLDANTVKKNGGQVIRAASGEQSSLILDRRIDALMFGISYKHPRVMEIAKGVDITMLPLEEAASKTVADKWGGKVCTIKKSEYDFLAADTFSVCIGLGAYVREDASEEMTYAITRAMFDQIATFQASHRLLKQFVTAQTLAEPGMVPHHKGAERYLREKGLLK